MQKTSKDNLQCIWMDAGIVSYKLCDKFFNCDNCLFYKYIQNPQIQESNTIHSEKIKDNYKTVFDMFLLPLKKNIFFPKDRKYFPNHLWLKKINNNIFLSGIDHIGAHFLSHFNEIILPEINSEIDKNKTLFKLKIYGKILTVKSPVHLSVLNINKIISDKPYIIKNDPYNKAWLFYINIKENELSKYDLNYENTFENFSKEQQFIYNSFSAVMEKCLPSKNTLNDGGIKNFIVPDIIGVEKYLSIVKKLFKIRKPF